MFRVGPTIFLLTLVAAMGGLLFGYDTAVISGAVGSLRAYFIDPLHYHDPDAANSLLGFVVSSALLGCILGGMLGGWVSTRLGRKRGLILAALLFVVSATGSACPELMFAPVGTGGATLVAKGIRIEVEGDPGPALEERTAYNPIFASEAKTLKNAVLKPIDDDGGGTGIEMKGADSQISLGKINFGAGADFIQLRATGFQAGTKLEAHIDSLDGPLIATLPDFKHDGKSGWMTTVDPTKGARGAHTLYLTCKAGTGPVEVHWIQFIRSAHPGQFYQAFDQIEAENYEVISGDIGVFPCTDATDSRTTTNITTGDYIGFKHIKLDASTKTFQARTSSGTKGGTIEIHLDSPKGSIVGVCKIGGTKGWDDWVTTKCPINLQGATGDHAVYLFFQGTDKFLFNLNWFKFTDD